MDKSLWSVLGGCLILLCLVYFADGQGNFMMRHGGGGYPGGGYPGGGYPGGGGGHPWYPGGGYPGGGYPGGGYPGGGWYPGGGGRHCKCRRYCFRNERYAGRCRRPWQYGRHHHGRRLVRCCPNYGPYY